MELPILGLNMVETLTQPIIGLDETFPENVYVLHHVASGKYGCFCHEGIHGLACFSTEMGAFRFAELIEQTGMQAIDTTFDEARDIAKGRPLPVVSIMLLDRINDPKVHFVR